MNTLLFISGGEIVIVVLVILLLFGADKIPEFARTFGKGMSEFRKATEEIKRELNESTKPFKEDFDDVKDAIGDHVDDFESTFSETTTESFDPYSVENEPYPNEVDMDEDEEMKVIEGKNPAGETGGEKVVDDKEVSDDKVEVKPEPEIKREVLSSKKKPKVKAKKSNVKKKDKAKTDTDPETEEK